MLIDISNNQPIATYPGSKDFKVNKNLDIDDHGINSSWLEIDCHYGTHIDSPSHFIKNGNTVYEFPEILMNGFCQIISYESFKDTEIKSNVIFLRFKNHSLNEKFDDKYISINLEDCEKLINNNIDIVGTNYLSIEKFGSDGNIHRKLLSNNIWIIESLNLESVMDGVYEYFCFPLKIRTEASPVRVVLKKIN